MQPQCLYWHQQADKENIVCIIAYIRDNTKYQCNQANYIRFLVHFLPAGPIINIKFNRERDLNIPALYYWIPLNCGPRSCISFIEKWVTEPNISILNGTKP